jgi:FG-GAP repeat
MRKWLQAFLPVIAAGLAACGAAPSKAPQKPAALTTHQDSSPHLAPPQPAEVEAKIARAFAGGVIVVKGPGAATLTGDFNGDGWQDIAVSVRAVGPKVAALEDPAALWSLEDPAQTPRPETVPILLPPPRPPPVRLRPGEELLAVIHGNGLQGWRAPLALQSYLLVNSGGGELTAEKIQGMNPVGERARGLPVLRGDVIREIRAGRPGFFYYDGAHYAWYAEHKLPSASRVRRKSR